MIAGGDGAGHTAICRPARPRGTGRAARARGRATGPPRRRRVRDRRPATPRRPLRRPRARTARSPRPAGCRHPSGSPTSLGVEFRVESGSVTDAATVRPHQRSWHADTASKLMIEARGLTKRFGSTLAVDDLSFDVLPGRVTGFLGPNGAGKSTTMRMILGLDHPTSGTARVLGKPYAQRRRPLYEVGAVLESRAVHGGRSAFNHLLCLAQSNGIGRARVEEALALVGLQDVGGRRARGLSLGMSQRLGLAAALLGNPQVLLCDEPVNGLDPEGI